MGDRVEVSTTISASPEHVYGLVSDLTRMGEWSPETQSCVWLGGATSAQAGARFKGTNVHGKHRWSSTCTIVAADPGRQLSWDVRFFGLPVARWSYEMTADGSGGTKVTESTEDKRPGFFKTLSPLGTGVKDRATHNRETMAATLERLKTAAEKS